MVEKYIGCLLYTSTNGINEDEKPIRKVDASVDTIEQKTKEQDKSDATK